MKTLRFLFNPQFIFLFVIMVSIGSFLSACESIDNGLNSTGIETYQQISVDMIFPMDTIGSEPDTLGIDEEEIIL